MTFAPSVERWRSLVTNYAGDLPVEFLLAWVSMESGGDPMSLGTATECGIFQIDFQDGPRFGASVATLHKPWSSLDDAGKRLQVTSGVAMVTAYRDRARAQLDAADADITEGSSDFWCFVKLQHALPCLPKVFLAWYRATFGTGPDSWSDFRDTIDAAPKADLSAAATKYGCPSVMNYFGRPGYPPGFGRFWKNAEKAGQYGGAELLGAGVLMAIAVPATVAVLSHVAGSKLPTGGT